MFDRVKLPEAATSSVGVEQVALWAGRLIPLLQSLGTVGNDQPQRSEATYRWLCQRSALGDP